MQSRPRFIQGVFPFVGAGWDTPVPLEGCPTYRVPGGTITQPVYFRAGNDSDGLIALVLRCDGEAFRYFPVGAGADSHVSLRVVQDLEVDTVLDVQLLAPPGTSGHVVLDIGLVEV